MYVAFIYCILVSGSVMFDIYMDTCLPVVCPDELFACNVGELKGYTYEGGVTIC